MRKMCLLSAISLALLSSTNSQAFEFQALQLQAAVGAEVRLSGTDTPKESFLNDMAVKIHVSTFFVPQDNVMLFFGYGGLKLELAPWIWIYPAIGANAMFSTTEQFIASLWFGLNFFDGQMSLFLEGDVYIGYEKNYDFYGYYAIDWNPTNFMNVGVQVEQVNDKAQFGPHLEFSYKVWHGGPQLYVGYVEGQPVWSVRVLSVVTF